MNQSQGGPQKSFQERIQRINAQHEEAAPPQGASASRRKRAAPEDKPKLPVVPFLIAAVLAAACVLIGSILAFHMKAITPNARNLFENSAAVLGPFGLAGLFLGVLMIGFGMRDKPHVLGIVAGAGVMYFAEPYLAYLLPDLWSGFYTPQHLENMLMRTGLVTPLGH
ncbi:hypothetical protein PH7735_01641 [Shimia thalassica]|uniref:Uncharacterized protein n=1 Tax=Shimia thalassica TaxID=1715693 RepID=A0A0P1I6R2_9RHOB|nr:hypothetical protein [Shimia thalassica]CUJ93604.1 hypothetical protein PH7735_01641 [Shimia thalassica]